MAKKTIRSATLNRRGFLEGSVGAGAAAVLAVGGKAAFAQAQSAPAPRPAAPPAGGAPRDVILGIFDEGAEVPDDGRSGPYRWPRVAGLDRAFA